MNAKQLTDEGLAEIICLDLWNEHRFQIDALRRFEKVLNKNLKKGKKEGDESALTSCLVHTRSLLEFYNPHKPGHADTIWWGLGLSSAATSEEDEVEWKRLSKTPWDCLSPWKQLIIVFLGHLSVERRTMDLPEDPVTGQRWPLLCLTLRTGELLDAYVDFVRSEGRRGEEVLDALVGVQAKVQVL